MTNNTTKSTYMEKKLITSLGHEVTTGDMIEWNKTYKGIKYSPYGVITDLDDEYVYVEVHGYRYFAEDFKNKDDRDKFFKNIMKPRQKVKTSKWKTIFKLEKKTNK